MNTTLQTHSVSFSHQGGSELPLIIIFGFVLSMIFIIRIFRYWREKMWHETARVALEKGQPLPEHFPVHRGCWGRGLEFRRGFILFAACLGMYISLPERARVFAVIPGFIGVAFVILGLLSYLLPNRASVPRDRDPSGKA